MTATALILALLALPISSGGESGRCSLALPIAAGPEDVVVLAVATPDRVSIDPKLELPRRGWRSSVDELPSEVWAQRFQVLKATGEVAGSLAVVPWGYDPTCRLQAWSDSVWVPPGDTVVFTLNRGNRSASRPHTYHVLGWHEPYPTGELIQYQGRGRGESPELAPQDYFDMLGVLPVDEERRGGSEEALARFRRWAAERGVLGHFPVNDILWFWERQVKWGG